jgi:hypothetical protein
LAEEAFKIANDPTKYPEQLKWVKPWQPKRIFWNVFIPGAFMSNKKPDEPGVISVETGLYNPLLGKSYGEIAAESRSQHKSQGFGVPANRGVKIDYLALKGGEPAPNDPFDGIDLSWKRVAGSEPVQQLINQAIANFKPENRWLRCRCWCRRIKHSVGSTPPIFTSKPNAWKLRRSFSSASDSGLKPIPATTQPRPGETIRVTSSVVNRTDYPVKLIEFKCPRFRKIPS